ncbi:hypothetical protein SERLA73DRAFT_160150 [Serpula lacrymans var. lacrymans S7.3]|uniref:Secreted protein n=2 Tax=Serpula lacrymans var. lacrymans TaxID=341189 RepID=F8PVF3_SERL3|nr:uncharacterized protein SERLADRAFT_355817 [Serpula lacrymans var. lacrymans S7.9]EGO00163.1 hypothetical protein SERLA73DRAFT_160150 [Serpula lacrymans var. lacrymans S7.3]EGO25724.1 hypothetical protein SERLADRAFT_355817 [Serpula lacrymans var. lacrymans S7.9]
MYASVFASLLALQAATGFATSLSKRGVDYYDPNANGGSMLDNAGDGYGEPLNVIISGLSSPAVLTEDGAINFARSIGFSEECFGFHLGGAQSANLGDGNGSVNQTIELREDYGSSSVGTCLESLVGGNHFRIYVQNGTEADSGALFLAVSKEEDVSDSHTIVPDGYDIGRNDLVSAAVGQTSFGGVSYTTTAQNVTGLLTPGSTGVNHGIAVDGIVTVLTVTIN